MLEAAFEPEGVLPGAIGWGEGRPQAGGPAWLLGWMRGGKGRPSKHPQVMPWLIVTPVEGPGVLEAALEPEGVLAGAAGWGQGRPQAEAAHSSCCPGGLQAAHMLGWGLGGGWVPKTNYRLQ